MKQWSWNWILVGTIISICFGYLGADRFYRGDVALGVIKLLTAGGLGVWYVVDAMVWLYRLGKTEK